MAVHLFLRGSLGADAESALIKSILERHGHSYVVHDVVNHPSSAEFMKRRCGTGVLSLPLLLVGKRTVWTASDMPPLEATGELQRMLAAAKTAHRARDEYKMGLSYLSGTGVRKDPFAAIDWLRRAANRGDAKAMAALGTLLVSGEAGVADEGEAGRWYDAAARKGNRSALLALGLLRLRQADHAPEGARNMLDHAARCFQQAGEEGVADAFVWLAHAQEKLARIDRGAKTGGGEGETFMETSAARQQRRVLYAKAAACGSAHGSFRLAHSLARGRLPPHPHAIMSPEILNGLQAATASGHAAAMFVYGCALLLGHLEDTPSRLPPPPLEEGLVAPHGRRKAEIKAEIENGHAGEGEGEGKGDGVDLGAVVRWWVASASAGHVAALSAIGQALLNGLGPIRLGAAATLSSSAGALAVDRTGEAGAPHGEAEIKADEAGAPHALAAATAPAARPPPSMPPPLPANTLQLLRSVVQYAEHTPRAASALAGDALASVAAAPAPTLLGAAPQVMSISSKAGAKGRRAAVGTSVKGRRATAGTSVKGRSSTAGSGGAHVPTIAQDYAAATAINSAAAAVASRSSTNAADGVGEVAGGNQYPLAAVTVAGRVAAAAKAAALLDDEARAFHLFEAAAQQGDAAGMAGLAECFLYGRGGVRRNVDVAVAWFAIAAAKKCPRAIVECEALTMAYGAGTVRRSRPTQRVLLATMGRGSKLYAIAKRCYEEGRGGEGRDSDGLRLRWAAQILNWCVRKGEARALVALGKLRLEGAGVTPSTEAAATLFERAAEHQHGPGALALARLHWEVRGDVFAAFVWFRIGAALGATAATAPLAQLASTLHPSLAAKAELRAAKWLKLHTGLAEMPPLASKETPLRYDAGGAPQAAIGAALAIAANAYAAAQAPVPPPVPPPAAPPPPPGVFAAARDLADSVAPSRTVSAMAPAAVPSRTASTMEPAAGTPPAHPVTALAPASKRSEDSGYSYGYEDDEEGAKPVAPKAAAPLPPPRPAARAPQAAAAAASTAASTAAAGAAAGAGPAAWAPPAAKSSDGSDDDGYYSGSYYSDEDEDDAPGQPGGAPPLSTAGYSPYGIAPPAKAEARGATAKTYSYNSESYRTGYSAGTDGPLAGVVDRQSKSAFADFTGKQQDDAEAEDEVAHGKDVVNLADIASSDLYDYYDD